MILAVWTQDCSSSTGQLDSRSVVVAGIPNGSQITGIEVPEEGRCVLLLRWVPTSNPGGIRNHAPPLFRYPHTPEKRVYRLFFYEKSIPPYRYPPNTGFFIRYNMLT